MYLRYLCPVMKKALSFFLVCFLLLSVAPALRAQCSVCKKTASQLGEKPAKGMNAGVLYLMVAPLAILGVIGYRWWRRNAAEE